MRYILQKVEKGQTSTGVEKATATIESVEGQVIEGVTLWKSSWPNFDALVDGLEVEGDYTEKQNGQWLNKNLYPPKEQKPAGKFGGGVAKAQEAKAGYIKQAQENKEEGIKVAGTMRDAVLCAIAEYNKDKTDLSTLEELITKWRQILWLQWDKTDTDFPAF